MTIKITNKRGGVGPSMKGHFYSYERNGKLVLVPWPKKGKRFRSEAQEVAKRLFREACDGLKRMDAKFLNYARENVKGTPMLPRDALMAAGYGRGPTIQFPDGRRIYSMATRIDMSMLLDNIGDQEGAMLYRGPDEFWVTLPPGEANQFLSVDENGFPKWVTAPSSGGGGGGWFIQTASSVGTTARMTIGHKLYTRVDLAISQILINHMFSASENYGWGVYAVNASNVITAVLGEGGIDPPRNGTQRYFAFHPPEPVEIPQGTNFVVCIRRLDAVTPPAMKLTYRAAESLFLPVLSDGNWWSMDSGFPAVGNAFIVSSGSKYCISFQG